MAGGRISPNEAERIISISESSQSLNELTAVKSDSFQEDPRLKNWNKWIQLREQMQRKLGEAFNRKPPSLVMNSIENVRSIREQKEMLEYTRIPAPPDRYRGGPEFWKSPDFLSDLGNPCLPLCSAVMSDVERSVVPTMTHVGVPTLIQIEKGVHGHSDYYHFKKFFEESDYLKEKRAQLKKEIKYVEPHKPLMDELVVKGKRILKPKKTVHKEIPVLTVSAHAKSMTEIDEEQSQASFMREFDEEKLFLACLKINGSLMSYEPPANPLLQNLHCCSEARYSCDGCNDWTLIFSAGIKEKREQCLQIENMGTVTVSYFWRKRHVSMKHSVCKNARDSSDARFFFNKNSGLFLPGQIVTVPFWFHSRSHGVFQEVWELETQPRVVHKNTSLVVTLWGMAAQEGNPLEQDIERIEQYLHERMSETTARILAQETFAIATASIRPPDPPYRSLFLEEDLFIHINTGYYYHPSVVETLKNLYSQVTCEPPEKWNLDLKSLRKAILSSEDLAAQQEWFKALSKSAQTLMSPCVMTRLQGKKHKAVYAVLCAFANAVDREAEALKLGYGLLKSPIKPLEKSNNKMLHKDPSKRIVGRSLEKTRNRPKSKSRQVFVADIGRLESFLEVPEPKLVTETPNSQKKRAQYLAAFYVKVYHHLGDTIEQVAAAVDSINYLENPRK